MKLIGFMLASNYLIWIMCILSNTTADAQDVCSGNPVTSNKQGNLLAHWECALLFFYAGSFVNFLISCGIKTSSYSTATNRLYTAVLNICSLENASWASQNVSLCNACAKAFDDQSSTTLSSLCFSMMQKGLNYTHLQKCELLLAAILLFFLLACNTPH